MQSTQLGHRRTCEGAEETLLQPAQTLLIPSLRTEENDLMENQFLDEQIYHVSDSAVQLQQAEPTFLGSPPKSPETAMTPKQRWIKRLAQQNDRLRHEVQQTWEKMNLQNKTKQRESLFRKEQDEEQMRRELANAKCMIKMHDKQIRWHKDLLEKGGKCFDKVKIFWKQIEEKQTEAQRLRKDLLQLEKENKRGEKQLEKAAENGMQNILSTKMKEYEVLLKVVKEAEEKDRHKMASINKQQQYLQSLKEELKKNQVNQAMLESGKLVQNSFEAGFYQPSPRANRKPARTSKQYKEMQTSIETLMKMISNSTRELAFKEKQFEEYKYRNEEVLGSITLADQEIAECERTIKQSRGKIAPLSRNLPWKQPREVLRLSPLVDSYPHLRNRTFDGRAKEECVDTRTEKMCVNSKYSSSSLNEQAAEVAQMEQDVMKASRMSRLRRNQTDRNMPKTPKEKNLTLPSFPQAEEFI